MPEIIYFMWVSWVHCLLPAHWHWQDLKNSPVFPWKWFLSEHTGFSS